MPNTNTSPTLHNARCTSHTTSAGGNPQGPIDGFIDGFIDPAPATRTTIQERNRSISQGVPPSCMGGGPPRTLVHVIVARARDLASCWNALADRVESAP